MKVVRWSLGPGFEDECVDHGHTTALEGKPTGKHLVRQQGVSFVVEGEHHARQREKLA